MDYSKGVCTYGGNLFIIYVDVYFWKYFEIVDSKILFLKSQGSSLEFLHNK